DAVVRRRVEAIGLGVPRTDATGPTDGKRVGADGGIGRARAPIEVHGRIDARELGGAEVRVVEVLAAQPSPSGQRGLASAVRNLVFIASAGGRAAAKDRRDQHERKLGLSQTHGSFLLSDTSETDIPLRG